MYCAEFDPGLTDTARSFAGVNVVFALKENIKFKKTQIFLLAFYRAYHGAEKNFSNLKFEYLSENELFNKTTVVC